MQVFVSCSSRTMNDEYLKISKEVSQVLINNNCSLICGGISSGMMREVFLEFIENKKHTTVVTLEIYNEDLSSVDDVYLMDDTFDRTKKIYSLMDFALFLPGGTGSLDELFSMMEEARTLKDKPLIIYNRNGHFDKVLSLFKDLIELGFNSDAILEKICIVNSLEELDKKIKNMTGGNKYE